MPGKCAPCSWVKLKSSRKSARKGAWTVVLAWVLQISRDQSVSLTSI